MLNCPISPIACYIPEFWSVRRCDVPHPSAYWRHLSVTDGQLYQALNDPSRRSRSWYRRRGNELLGSCETINVPTWRYNADKLGRFRLAEQTPRMNWKTLWALKDLVSQNAENRVPHRSKCYVACGLFIYKPFMISVCLIICSFAIFVIKVVCPPKISFSRTIHESLRKFNLEISRLD